jgi:DNA-binding NarL/FixJ family response regulator
MGDTIDVLIAGDNLWLLHSTQSLVQDAVFIGQVATCSIQQVRAAAERGRPDVILVLNGAMFIAHLDVLTRLRTEQPVARIIMTTVIEDSLYEGHPFAANFDALIEEARLSHALIPTIHRLVSSVSED